MIFIFNLLTGEDLIRRGKEIFLQVCFLQGTVILLLIEPVEEDGQGDCEDENFLCEADGNNFFYFGSGF